MVDSPTPRVRFRLVSDQSKIYDSISVVWVSPTVLNVLVPSETARMPVGDYFVVVENPDRLSGQWYTDGAMMMPGAVYIVFGIPIVFIGFKPLLLGRGEPTKPLGKGTEWGLYAVGLAAVGACWWMVQNQSVVGGLLGGLERSSKACHSPRH